MLLGGRKEQMILVQKNWIEHRVNDVPCESWLLTSNPLYGTPFHIALDVIWNLELAVHREIIIDFQKPLLHSFYSCTCTDIDKLP